METKKYLGIWMDHSNAHLVDISTKNSNQTITSKFTFEVKEKALNKGETLMNNKEEQMHESYYKEIAVEILKYENVLLFGPTKAKEELNNYLNKDLHFKDIKIDVLSADKMTDNQQIAFVKNHFNK